MGRLASCHEESAMPMLRQSGRLFTAAHIAHAIVFCRSIYWRVSCILCRDDMYTRAGMWLHSQGNKYAEQNSYTLSAAIVP